jgi:hypothetical protein
VAHHWKGAPLNAAADVFNLLAELRGKQWLCRGQSRPYNSLIPSIDRKPRDGLPRIEKLRLERESINLFRATARFFNPGEQGAREDDNIALMVLRHFGVPTRLLDWSWSPYVAAYFAVCHNNAEIGEIWGFDYHLYAQRGKDQWKKWPETTLGGSGHPDDFRAQLTAFSRDEPPDWFICGFYPDGFPRQHAQEGVYSMTARFDRDHAENLELLLNDSSRYSRYEISVNLKCELRRSLRERHGIWCGALYPDTAGAAQTAQSVFES